VSKIPKYPSWVEREFGRKTAREIHKRHLKWQRGRRRCRNSNAPTMQTGFYQWGLLRDGRLDELAKHIADEKRVAAHWAALIGAGKVSRRSEPAWPDPFARPNRRNHK